MIEINLTLLIQAFHFLCAYLLIRFLFLKPISRIIYKEEQEHHTVLASLIKQKEQVSAIEQEKKRIWNTCQRYFAAHTPDLHASDLTHFKINVQSIERLSFDDSLIKQHAQKIEQLIIASPLDINLTHNQDKTKGRSDV